jgi:hypothetical protein
MKKIWKFSIFSIGLSLILAPAAYADQCAYLNKDRAIAAFQRLNIGQNIYELCEPCGEKVPKTVAIKSTAIQALPSPGNWQILVNGKGLDLAYTFVDYSRGSNTSRSRVNLAMLANCPASDVSLELIKK